MSELKYYKYVEQDKNYLKFYCVLELKHYQFAGLTDTVDRVLEEVLEEVLE